MALYELRYMDKLTRTLHLYGECAQPMRWLNRWLLTNERQDVAEVTSAFLAWDLLLRGLVSLRDTIKYQNWWMPKLLCEAALCIWPYNRENGVYLLWNMEWLQQYLEIPVLVYQMLHHHSMAAYHHQYHILSIVWFRIIWLTTASATSWGVQVPGLVTWPQSVIRSWPGAQRRCQQAIELKC